MHRGGGVIGAECWWVGRNGHSCSSENFDKIITLFCTNKFGIIHQY